MKKLIAANWKMYKSSAEAHNCVATLLGFLGKKAPENKEILVFPPFTAIKAVSEVFAGGSGFFAGGQNFYPEPEGAFTGEIALGMLREAGASWVLAGHSERRSIFGESNELVGRKTAYAYEAGLGVVLCIGETLAQRENGELEQVLTAQLEAGMAGLPVELDGARLAVAYEPVWAIGTGKVAGTGEIAEAHNLVRKILGKISPRHGAELRILYGGSVKADNAGGIMAVDNVDGVLVGGASLDAEKFSKIALA